MRDAMERVVTVNAKRDSTAPNEEFGIDSGGEFGIGSVTKPDDYGRDFGIATPSPAALVLPRARTKAPASISALVANAATAAP